MLTLLKAEATRLIGTGPVFPVPDVAASVAFYCDVLGFDLDFVMDEPPSHGSVTSGGVGVQFTRSTDAFLSREYPGWTYIFVDGIDALYARYRSQGVEITRPLESHEHGMREFEIQDLDGFRLRFGQYL